MTESVNWKALHEEALLLADRHATETGRVISAWNLFQDMLGTIFAEISGPTNHKMALAIWYSQDSDRSQRRMLKAASKSAFGEEAQIYKEIKWICDRADSLADDRNNIAHVGYSIDFDPTHGVVKIQPRGIGHYDRADKMNAKDIFDELQIVENNCKALFTYTAELTAVAAFPDQFPDPKPDEPSTWPDRPSLLKAITPPTPKPKASLD